MRPFRRCLPALRSTVAAGLCLALAACVFLPRTTVIYDPECQIAARHMVLEVQQLGTFVSCHGEGCAAVLAGLGLVSAASAVVSGSIVIAGNIVYWFEKRGNCIRQDWEPPAVPPPGYPRPPAGGPPPGG